MNDLSSMIPLLIPIIIIQLGLMITALVSLLKNKKVKILNVPIWVIIILFVNLVGPILYFILGRDAD